MPDTHTTSVDQQRLEKERIEDDGTVTLTRGGHAIHCLTVIGQVEGHTEAPQGQKTTKYEHVIPQLAAVQEDPRIEGLLVLLNTVGGDVEAGLAIAELIRGMSKPSVSLVLGGSHSIGVPIAVSTDYSYIVPSGTMEIHPVRMNGTVIGAQQTYDYFRQIQDRITGFVCSHCSVSKQRMEEMMIRQGMLSRDLGTILVGEQAVYEGIISSVGGIREAVQKLHELADGYRAGRMKKKNSNSDKKKIK